MEERNQAHAKCHDEDAQQKNEPAGNTMSQHDVRWMVVLSLQQPLIICDVMSCMQSKEQTAR
eukprot:1548719-Amphidinium_carterae.2